MKDKNVVFLGRAIKLAEINVSRGGGPFGAVITRDDKIVAESANAVTLKNDPTAHAEIEVIRKAAKKLKTFDLSECTLYASCEPCPMCLAAIYWAGIKKVYYGATKEEASKAGFKDAFIYKEFLKTPQKRKLKQTQLKTPKNSAPFKTWNNSDKKIKY